MPSLSSDSQGVVVRPPRWRSTPFLPLLVLLVIAVVLTTAGIQLQRQWRDNVDRQLQTAADQAALRLEDYLATRLIAVRSLARTYGRMVHTDDDFRTRSRIIQREFGGFQALNLVDDRGVLRIVVPEETNQGAVGRSVLDHPVAASHLREAQRTGDPQLTAPLELFQGGRGVVAYFPVRRDGQHIASLNGVFRIEDVVERALGIGILDHYTVRVTDGTERLFGPIDADPGLPRARAALTLLAHTWVLETGPGPELWAELQAARPTEILAFAALLGAATVWLLHVLLARQAEVVEALQRERVLERELAQVAKMDALGRLAGGIAHDFNNVLTAIIGAADGARMATGEPDTREALAEILSTSHRAADITRQLLALGTQPAGQLEVLYLDAHVGRLSGLLERLTPEPIHVRLDLSANASEALWPVRAAPGQVSQLVLNLVMNAAHAMPHGGFIDVSTHNATREDASEVPPGDWVVLGVRDHGHGIDAATRERLFERGFTTRAEHGGTGLGLATVRAIVDQLQGHILVTSELHRGTRFEIWLPRSEDVGDASDTPAAPAPPRTLRLLLVEDEEPVRRALVRSLSARGHEVLAVADAHRALELLDDPDHAFDAMVTDVVMRGMGGVELLEAVRARGERFRVVLCSGHADRAIDAEALELLDARYLSKPFSPDELLTLLS